MDEIKVNLLRPFGPSILYAKIPNTTVSILNEYVENIIESQKKSEELDHGDNLVGHVTQEFRIEEEVARKSGWVDFLSKCINFWITNDIKKSMTKLDINSSWIVRQFKNEYNPTHWHTGHLSGAGFLKVPNTWGEHVQNKEQGYQGGRLQLIHGSRMFLSPSTFNIEPKVGDFYFFPNYLMHTVFPFSGTEEERRSISFNAVVNDDLYNVYS